MAIPKLVFPQHREEGRSENQAQYVRTREGSQGTEASGTRAGAQDPGGGVRWGKTTQGHRGPATGESQGLSGQEPQCPFLSTPRPCSCCFSGSRGSLGKSLGVERICMVLQDFWGPRVGFPMGKGVWKKSWGVA